MTKNSWRDCKKEPPKQYTRVEIKDNEGKIFIGYRHKNVYLETLKNLVIKYPRVWREVEENNDNIKQIKRHMMEVFLDD